MAKTFSEWVATLSAVTGLGAGDKVPVVEGGTTKYVEGDDFGGGITALTGDVTASGSGSVAATIANGAVDDIMIAAGVDAVKIADGTVTNTEFQYLGSVTSDIQTQLDAKVDENGAIVAATKTKITYDTKGLVTAGADATTADIAASTDKNYVTDAQLTVIGNTSGTNTGDQSSVTGNAGTVTVADAAGDTTTWVLLGTAQTGNLSPATDAGITYNATTNALTASTFIGALTGNADTVTGFSGTSSGNNTGDVTLAGTPDYLTIAGQVITLGSVNLTTDVTGTLPIGNGGTGLAVLGTANQQLRVNAGATALEYFTPSAASGDITNGGNTTGAALTIGTNDNFGLNLETSGVTRMAITGGTGVGGQVTITNVTANTNTVSDGLTIQTNSTGTAANSFGGGILFQGESSTTDNRDMVRLSSIWTTATDASRASALVYSDVTAGGALTERFRFTPTAMTLATPYTIGNSSSVITISCTANAANAVTLTTAGQNAGIRIGNTASTATGLNKTAINTTDSYTAASGSGTYTYLSASPTFNLTGTASGTQRIVLINPTLTSLGGTTSLNCIEIAADHASAKGIYQTGSSTTNNFVGGTMFGSTSAVSAVAAIEVSSTTKGILLPRMTEAERDAISAVAGLLIYNTTTNKMDIYTTAWEEVTSA